MRPIAIPPYIKELWTADAMGEAQLAATIKQQYATFNRTVPEVSVVIPAYNEERNILRTLLSLSGSSSRRAIEIVVVNNNSKDRTEALVRAAGIPCITETRQGITAARNAGLAAARGVYMLNADADSIYPADWIDEMVRPLESNSVSITYGRFAFIPTGSTSRLSYYLYEHMADKLRRINKLFREEAVNVYGFNSGFRRVQGLEVDGFDHPPGANEDGWLAVKLRDKGFGQLHCVTAARAMVWTADRRIEADGGLWKALFLRFKRVLFPAKQIEIRKDL